MCDEIRNKFVNSMLECRELILNNKVDDDIIESIVLQIKQWNDDDDLAESESRTYKRETNPIKLYINSPGGDADAMFSCISVILTSKTPVYTYCLGKAYSAGFLIFLAGHKRFAQMYSRFMCHQLGYGVSFSELQTHVELLEFEVLTQGLVENFILSRTKVPKKKLEEIRKSKVDWYFYACEENIKKYNIFHEYF